MPYDTEILNQKAMKQKILKFGDYRIKSALFLQEEIKNFQELEMSIINNYYYYLKICGVNNLDKIRKEFDNLRYQISPRFGIDFKQETRDNINSIVDEIVTRLIKK